MTRRNKLIILVTYLVILSVVMLSYRMNRAKKVKAARAQLAQNQASKDKIRKGEAQLQRLTQLIPASANLPELVASLYRFASQAGLKQHAVATEADKQQGTARPERSLNTSSVVTNRIKVAVAGNFRQIAEYVRQVQNLERFNRIVEIKLTPNETSLQGTMTIEFFSLPVKP